MDIPRSAPPLPDRAVLSQRWSSACFLHWRVDPDVVAPLLPAGTRPDTFDGSAWVGLIPFVLSEFRVAAAPALPLIREFIEINVRTYAVDGAGRRGVVFRTLEAQHLLPVLGARTLFGLPYRWARASRHEDGADVVYTSSRRGRSEARTRIGVTRGDGPVDTPLSRFLTARWGFHQRHLGRTVWAANSHEPWPLVAARLNELDDTLVADAGFPGLVGRTPDSVLAMPAGHPGVVTDFSRSRRIPRD